MATLHRRALTMVTRREEKHPAFRWAWCFLRAGYKARGLSCHDVRVRWFRFWREVKAHRRHWDRPGVEAEEGGPGIPPTGMRRHVEVIAARLARGACAAAGKRVEVLDELVERLPRRLALLRRLWLDPAVTAEEHRRFEGLMREIGRRVRKLKRWIYRGKRE